MRDKLNNSPIAQVALIAILLAGGAYFLLSSQGGGGNSSTTAQPTATVPTTTTPAPATTATTPATSPATAAGTAMPTDIGAAEPTSAAASVPVPPLPAPLRRAYDSGETVVLLVVRGGGIDDSLVTPVVRRLKAAAGVAVFITRAKRIARYAAITLGVNVDRVPALVVVRPRSLSGGHPQATVTYGFQSPAAIVQAVIDASYNGPAATYHPN